MNSSGMDFKGKKESGDARQLPVPEKILEKQNSRNASQTNFNNKTRKEVVKEPQFDSKYNDYSKLFV
jgi:hypothetical protein